MEFVWNDGGRAASGFVGLAGDCVTRAIAIATGTAYRTVYDRLGEATEKSPRNGIATTVADEYLQQKNWQRTDGKGVPFNPQVLPKGVVIVHVAKENRCHHFTTLVDGVVHDTWDPTNDDYVVKSYWTSEAAQSDSRMPAVGPLHRAGSQQELTQTEFDKILSRLRALDRTASNSASTEGEKHNALRMMQSLMLRHNLSREDITDEDNVASMRFIRKACPINGSSACRWEKNLAFYITTYIFPTTQYYRSTRAHRTLFWFYGPVDDVQNAIALFRELLLTIAAQARLQFGGHTRGSGASYAEGYVAGLPRWSSSDAPATHEAVLEGMLIQARTLSVTEAAEDWLDAECGVKLVRTRGTGRHQHDEEAANRGKRDGASQEIKVPNAPLRISQK